MLVSIYRDLFISPLISFSFSSLPFNFHFPRHRHCFIPVFPPHLIGASSLHTYICCCCCASALFSLSTYPHPVLSLYARIAASFLCHWNSRYPVFCISKYLHSLICQGIMFVKKKLLQHCMYSANTIAPTSSPNNLFPL